MFLIAFAQTSTPLSFNSTLGVLRHTNVLVEYPSTKHNGLVGYKTPENNSMPMMANVMCRSIVRLVIIQPSFQCYIGIGRLAFTWPPPLTVAQTQLLFGPWNTQNRENITNVNTYRNGEKCKRNSNSWRRKMYPSNWIRRLTSWWWKKRPNSRINIRIFMGRF